MPVGKEKFAQGILVRLFRRWSACRATGQDELPAMLRVTDPLGLSGQTALSCASLFELVEAHLDRVLVPECCCAPGYSPDENALVALLRLAPSVSSLQGSQSVPHGLPDVICWSVVMVRHAFDLPDGTVERSRTGTYPECPFETPATSKGARRGI